LTHNEYFALGAGLHDLPSHFYPIKSGKADVEHNQVWLQIQGFMNRLQSVRSLADDLEVLHSGERRASEPPKRFVVIYNQSPHY
jgi:hypothetical protein